MKKISPTAEARASSIAPVTVSTGAKANGAERAAGKAHRQYRKVPRKMPSVHWVTRSLTKLTRMRGENCIEASVKVISRMAKTIETTVMTDDAVVPSITCATCASDRDGNRMAGTQSLNIGKLSSNEERAMPVAPSAYR